VSDIPIDKRFAVLSHITRAQHFAWREAVTRICPDVDTREVVLEMWRITGEQTARSYATRVNPDEPIAAQVASAISWSSQCMGEDAAVEAGETEREAFVRHTECPWKTWHERCDLVSEDQPGCDRWFASTIDTMNDALGSRIRFETIETLPEGGQSCLRRIWDDS
jgi:hypothetical protein